jgi:DNA-binding XRE family transcriptional regulator
MSLKRNEKKEWAKLLFLRENITQKEIAEKVGVSQKTIGTWIEKDNWDKMKNCIMLTRTEELTRLHSQLREFNDHIENKPAGQRFPNKAEADALTSIKSAIKAFEGETSIREIVDVSRDVLTWLRPVDFEKAKEISHIFDQFIKSKLK